MSKQCEYIVRVIGKGLFRTKHRCKNVAMKNSKYCYQHKGG